jgi:hypothetical protein
MRSYLEKNPSQKTAGGVAQGEGLEFKPQYHKKKKKKNLIGFLDKIKYTFKASKKNCTSLKRLN